MPSTDKIERTDKTDDDKKFMDDGEGQSASLLERGSAIEKNVFSSFPAAPHGANPTSHRRAGREGRMLQSQWRKGQNSTISQLGRHERGLPASKEKQKL